MWVWDVGIKVGSAGSGSGLTADSSSGCRSWLLGLRVYDVG